MSEEFIGYHSEWNLGSPGGWDYQRITQEIGKEVWNRICSLSGLSMNLNFDHSFLYPINGFVEMLVNAWRIKEAGNSGLIAVMAEEETLEDVTENRNLVRHLNKIEGVKSVLLAPHHLEINNGNVSYLGKPVGLIFMDFNTNILLDLHRKHDLTPVLQAVREGRVINPRGTEPVNSKGVFEVLTDPDKNGLFNPETVRRTPWTRQFYDRKTTGPDNEEINDLIEWTRKNWDDLVLKPERGYSGKGVKVGGKDTDVDNIIENALKEGDYIVQKKIPLNLWGEMIPEIDMAEQTIRLKQFQTDFRCLFGDGVLMGFLGRVGGIPTNVGSGGGVQSIALVEENADIRDMSNRINEMIMNLGFEKIAEISKIQNNLALENRFTYLLGPIKIALRPRLLKISQMRSLETYCQGIWADCLILERLWKSDKLGIKMEIDPKELEIIRSQPWNGSPAILASDGLFSFGAHIL
jgi:hypothetical protein